MDNRRTREGANLFPWMISRHFRQVLIVTAALSLFPTARAEVRISSLFGNHMVLQQGIEAPIWGRAKPGERVAITFHGVTVETVANETGKWTARIGPLKKSSDPTTLIIKGENEIVLQDVLVGEVWVCSGQSNMAFNLKAAHDAVAAISRANQPGIRFFKVRNAISFSSEEECEGQWVICTSEKAGNFSAVGFFFAEQIHKTQNAPVGMIQAAINGTPAQAWTSFPALQSDPALSRYVVEFEETKTNLWQLLKRYEEEDLPRWKEKVKSANLDIDSPQLPREFKRPISPDKNSDLPTVLFNGMVGPLIPYGIKGVIWYQGEANVVSPEEYATLFPIMIRDWRGRWGQGDFPFLFVQLAGYGSSPNIPILRNAQLKTLALPKTGMALSIDVGDEGNIHPKNKFEVGQRLALAARGVAYGENIVFSGPIFRSMSIAYDKTKIIFDHVGGGLVIGIPPPSHRDGKFPALAEHLQGFEIAGKDGKFVPARAEINENTVVV